jgi:hypothetical protein
MLLDMVAIGIDENVNQKALSVHLPGISLKPFLILQMRRNRHHIHSFLAKVSRIDPIAVTFKAT